MQTTTLDCPIVGLCYEKHEAAGKYYYSITPMQGYRMRVRAKDQKDGEGHTLPFYAHRLALPRPYDFAANAKQLEGEAI